MIKEAKENSMTAKKLCWKRVVKEKSLALGRTGSEGG